MKHYIGKHTGNLWDFEVKFNYDDDVETQRQKIKDTIADPSFQKKLFLLFKLKEGDVLGLYGKETDTGDYWKICDVEVHGKEDAEIDSWNDLGDQKEELDEVVDWDEYFGEVSREKILEKMKTAKEARIRHRKIAQWGNVESRERVKSLTRAIKHYEALLKKMDDEGLDKISLYEDKNLKEGWEEIVREDLSRSDEDRLFKALESLVNNSDNIQPEEQQGLLDGLNQLKATLKSQRDRISDYGWAYERDHADDWRKPREMGQW